MDIFQKGNWEAVIKMIDGSFFAWINSNIPDARSSPRRALTARNREMIVDCSNANRLARGEQHV